MENIAVETVISEVLQRPANEGALIAEKLISSLDENEDTDVEAAWQNEIEKRLDDIDSGKVQCLPWEEVRKKLYE